MPSKLMHYPRKVAIRDGEVVCIFAEGEITRIGQLLPFRRGMERIMKDVDAPIIPIALDGVAGAARGVSGLGRQDVLSAGGRGVAVVDDDRQVVGAVEHRVGDAAGQPVVPEAAVAHDADRALAAGAVERRGTGRAGRSGGSMKETGRRGGWRGP